MRKRSAAIPSSVPANHPPPADQAETTSGWGSFGSMLKEMDVPGIRPQIVPQDAGRAVGGAHAEVAVVLAVPGVEHLDHLAHVSLGAEAKRHLATARFRTAFDNQLHRALRRNRTPDPTTRERASGRARGPRPIQTPMDFLLIAAIAAASALVFAFLQYGRIMKWDPGTQEMQDIAKMIQDGAKAFLFAEYRWLLVFVAVVAVAIGASPAEQGLGMRTAIAFVFGAFASGLAGYFGMHTATRAAVRTTQAATNSLQARHQTPRHRRAPARSRPVARIHRSGDQIAPGRHRLPAKAAHPGA